MAATLVEGSRIARLATRSVDGLVDLVPITFAFVADRLVTVVDHKPKTTKKLKRLDNIRANSDVDILVDDYDDDDWSALWWVRLRGHAEVIEDGEAYGRAVDGLVEKYAQYRATVPAGPVISVELRRWQWWSANG